MKVKTLLLITNYFPFFKGEEYLETEILFLSRKYNQIIIIPTMNDKSMTITRNVPNNCKIFPVDYDLSRWNRLNFVFKIVDLDKQQRLNADTVGSKLYLRYFENRAKYIENKVLTEDLIKMIENENIDIYSYWLYVTARVAIAIKKYLTDASFKIDSLISRAHRYDLYENESKLNYLPERQYLLTNLDKVFPCSLDGKQHIVDRYPEYEDKVGVAYLGTHKGVYKKHEKSLENVIVSCSGMRKVKRIELIVEALAILEKKGIKFHWIHFGDGPEWEIISKLASQVLSDNSYDLMGNVNNEELQKWYDNNHADIFLNVSTSEGVPVSIMEAMSRGIPIIATDVGGTRELMSENGTLLDRDFQPEQLTNAIKEIFDSPHYQEMSENSFDIWSRKFNSDKNYTQFADAIFNNDY